MQVNLILSLWSGLDSKGFFFFRSLLLFVDVFISLACHTCPEDVRVCVRCSISDGKREVPSRAKTKQKTKQTDPEKQWKTYWTNDREKWHGYYSIFYFRQHEVTATIKLAHSSTLFLFFR